MSIARLLSILLISGIPMLGYAEPPDREQPINIRSNSMSYDHTTRINLFQGEVVLTQGTLLLETDNLQVKEDGEGYQYGTATQGGKKLAYFRKKRALSNEYVEGWGEKIQYDTRNEKLDIIGQARLRRGQDEVHGYVINYDVKTEFYTVQSNQQQCLGENANQCRARAVIIPKKETPPARTIVFPSPSPIPSRP